MVLTSPTLQNATENPFSEALPVKYADNDWMMDLLLLPTTKSPRNSAGGIAVVMSMTGRKGDNHYPLRATVESNHVTRSCCGVGHQREFP